MNSCFMKDFEMLAKQWETAILSPEDTLLIVGGDSAMPLGNNCKCNGNDCDCLSPNNCNCGSAANNCHCDSNALGGNNCKCGSVVSGENKCINFCKLP